MRFEIVIKEGPLLLARVKGRDISNETLTVGDMEKVIETEQYLERLTGLRFHISPA